MSGMESYDDYIIFKLYVRGVLPGTVGVVLGVLGAGSRPCSEMEATA